MRGGLGQFLGVTDWKEEKVNIACASGYIKQCKIKQLLDTFWVATYKEESESNIKIFFTNKCTLLLNAQHAKTYS
jgi:hypothetical protein